MQNLRYSPAVTTPPTPAGWYPDPDGSGGQRYWDGSSWTEHRSPATPEPAEPTAPAETPGSEQTTSGVPLPPAGGHSGAHRAPESEAAPEATHEPEPEYEPQPGPSAIIDPGSSVPSEQTTSVIPTPPAAPTFLGEPPAGDAFGEPATPAAFGEPAAHDRRRKDIVLFGVTCAGLMAVLIAVVVYAVFIHKDNTIAASSGPKSTTKSAPPSTTSVNGWGGGTETTSESPAPASGSGPRASDGSITFALTGTETAASVKSQDAPAERNAQGQYVIVHLTVSNTGDKPATFVGTFQKLKAGGSTYSIDDVATAYLNGTVAQLNPGDNSKVAIAFDVPAGTTPDSLEVHGDSTGAGAEVPLS
ncbi:MAG: hypothetical protein NVS4B6_17340 [Mycobacterium sp.]